MKILSETLCFVFGHNYILKRKITRSIREVACVYCEKEFAMNDELQTLLPLDDEFRRLHNDILEDEL